MVANTRLVLVQVMVCRLAAVLGALALGVPIYQKIDYTHKIHYRVY